jgi:hypothetical protein
VAEEVFALRSFLNGFSLTDKFAIYGKSPKILKKSLKISEVAEIEIWGCIHNTLFSLNLSMVSISYSVCSLLVF